MSWTPLSDEYTKSDLGQPDKNAVSGRGRTRNFYENRMDEAQDGRAGLPHEKGFPIQVGSELFRLSGASIMSDGQYITCTPVSVIEPC